MFIFLKVMSHCSRIRRCCCWKKVQTASSQNSQKTLTVASVRSVQPPRNFSQVSDKQFYWLYKSTSVGVAMMAICVSHIVQKLKTLSFMFLIVLKNLVYCYHCCHHCSAS